MYILLKYQFVEHFDSVLCYNQLIFKRSKSVYFLKSGLIFSYYVTPVPSHYIMCGCQVFDWSIINF